MADVRVIEAKPPCKTFERLRGAADGGLDLGIGLVGGKVKVYQERRSAHPVLGRAVTVCRWEAVYKEDLEHQLRAARARCIDVDAVLRMMERRNRER